MPVDTDQQETDGIGGRTMEGERRGVMLDERLIRLISLEKLYVLWNGLPDDDPQRATLDREIRRRTVVPCPLARAQGDQRYSSGGRS